MHYLPGHCPVRPRPAGTYRIAGSFRMVQNFAVFADSSAAAEIRTTNFSSLSSANYGLSVGVVSPEC